MNRLTFILTLLALALSACASPSQPTAPALPFKAQPVISTQSSVAATLLPKAPMTTPDATRPIPPLNQSPQRPPLPASQNNSGVNYTVTNPTTNAQLNVTVFAPQTAAAKKFPAVVLVPGGSGDGSGLTRDALQFAQANFVAVTFDPDGRGKSTGTEDYNGFKHQDGLAAVIRFVAALSQVDPQKIGIVTNSYGITMGSGVLARYTDLPVKFLIDWEGPADRTDTGGCDGQGKGHLKTVAQCTNEKFWSEREALTFIAKISVPYQRVQSEKDHVQPDNSHAVNMINAAVKGGVPWVRLNDYPTNQTYDPKAPPPMFPESRDRESTATMIHYAQELLK